MPRTATYADLVLALANAPGYCDACGGLTGRAAGRSAGQLAGALRHLALLLDKLDDFPEHEPQNHPALAALLDELRAGPDRGVSD